MTVHKILPAGFAANCYLLTEDGKNAVAIDPSQPRVLEEAKRLSLEIRYTLLTHGHFDHMGGCLALQQAGAKTSCPEKDLPNLQDANRLSRSLGYYTIPLFTPDFTVSEGEITLCGIRIKVIETPGHTVGGVSYLADGVLFTGDTMFYEGEGRCDLPTGSYRDLQNSLLKLYRLEGDYKVCPGHGRDSTLSHERDLFSMV